MSKRVIDRYCHRVSRLLLAPTKARQSLIKGLHAELSELPTETTQDLEALITHYGAIPETAMALQDAIPADERAVAINRRRLYRRLIGAAVFLLILVLVVSVILLRFMPVIYAQQLPNGENVWQHVIRSD